MNDSVPIGTNRIYPQPGSKHLFSAIASTSGDPDAYIAGYEIVYSPTGIPHRYQPIWIKRAFIPTESSRIAQDAPGRAEG
jgi:hypothetical protein